jgi:probable phosphoglycerate mutase
MSGAEILLLRHGQSEGNEGGRLGGHGPTPLTALGRRQAEATAKLLLKEGRLDRIVCSDLPRAVQTAEPTARLTGIAIEETPALRERSVGLLTGLTFAEANRQFPQLFASLHRRDVDACPPEGETTRTCYARAAAIFDEIVAQRGDRGRTLIVSHSVTLDLVVKHALGIGVDVSRALHFRVDNCALHRLRHLDKAAWHVDALNDRRHLIDVK